MGLRYPYLVTMEEISLLMETVNFLTKILQRSLRYELGRGKDVHAWLK